MQVTFYPIHDFGPLMKGLVIGGMGIVHVFLAQFAIGGGLLLTWFEYLRQKHGYRPGGLFLGSFFRALVLVSFVLGALTGVGMWLTAIQVSPQTIGLMVREFHWIWAVEWTFFALEIAAGYTYYRYAERLDDRARLRLLVLYSLAGWFSLFWVNGILSWQLTPGAWLDSRQVWDGFFNPSFWPSLLYRTVAAMAIAALVAAIVINAMDGASRAERAELLAKAARFLWPMVSMPLLGAWYLASMPDDSRSWVLGGSAAMTLMFALGAGASLLVGAYAVVGLLLRRLYINAATATLLCALALGATAAGEFVREGSRKPFTVREVLYSNAVTPGQIAALRRDGSVSSDPYPLRHPERYPNSQLVLGAKVVRFQCSVCHTMDGANGLLHLTRTWTGTQLRLNVAKLQYTKPFMPPFAGNAEELEALVQFLRWRSAGQPAAWPESRDPQLLAQIERWLEEAGTDPQTTPLAGREP